MALTYGFYNSLDGDRKYNAMQFGAIFDGVISDGVYSAIGGRMMVQPAGSGMNVNIQTGRAWFNHRWTLNDSVYVMELPNPEALLDKYVAVVLEVNEGQTVRGNSFKYVAGTPASSPVYPTLTNTSEIHQYPLAYVLIKHGATTITTADIANMVGTSACPFVTGVVTSFNIDQLVGQWQAQWNAMVSADKSQWTNLVSTSARQWSDMITADVTQFSEMMTTNDGIFSSFMQDSNSSFDTFMQNSEDAFTAFVAAEDAEFDKNMDQMEADFGSFWNDFKAGMVAYLAEQQDIWEAWLSRIQGQISEDAATRLQAEIDAISYIYVRNNRIIFGTSASVAGNRLSIAPAA